MHELSIVESLLNLALENAAKVNARKIVGITWLLAIT
jgi:Zn finger protein HypA/HybF involved in hydrogenase expression